MTASVVVATAAGRRPVGGGARRRPLSPSRVPPRGGGDRLDRPGWAAGEGREGGSATVRAARPPAGRPVATGPGGGEGRGEGVGRGAGGGDGRGRHVGELRLEGGGISSELLVLLRPGDGHPSRPLRGSCGDAPRACCRGGVPPTTSPWTPQRPALGCPPARAVSAAASPHRHPRQGAALQIPPQPTLTPSKTARGATQALNAVRFQHASLEARGAGVCHRGALRPSHPGRTAHRSRSTASGAERVSGEGRATDE